ncbi:MAG: hypothetical protein C4527_25445 [Candidatus Omnitrophota bacterium]|jgi:hypothetical protein|nr:MAG: hypothetical protein C4527_25445 [Candidatus Omnitrophota bacterium]
MWLRAKGHERTFRFSTLFTAQDVQKYFTSDEKIDRSIAWCKEHGITRVFIETFRDGFTAEKETLARARDQFRQEGLIVSGCVTPTGMGVASNGWKVVSNYESPKTLEQCRRIFEYTASLFDEIMIDDFLFTDDASPLSQQAKGARTWAEYRCDLMLGISREYILGPVRDANPRAEVIIKYPQWYDNFHERGYNVDTQTDIFDHIWVGTETRDPDAERWGRKAQYEAYYIMRWLTDVGGEKTGGGWFDIYDTSPETYVEQARQTILGGAREALLFHFGALQKDRGAKNIEVLLHEMPTLFLLAEAVADAQACGVLAPKIPNSSPGKEPYVYDFLGMLGVPLVPFSRIDTNFCAALFAMQSWQNDIFPVHFEEFSEEGKPVVITGNLHAFLQSRHFDIPDSTLIFPIPEDPRSLYEIDPAALRRFREHLLKPLGLAVEGPTKVSLYLYDNGVLAVENFRDESARFSIQFQTAMEEAEQIHTRNTFFALPSEPSAQVNISENRLDFQLSPRSAAVVKLSESRFTCP